jgi:uridylate kinase
MRSEAAKIAIAPATGISVVIPGVGKSLPIKSTDTVIAIAANQSKGFSATCRLLNY